jgi:Holliday junction resolvase
MTRDTYEQMTLFEREGRGRLGDRESADPRAGARAKSDLVDLDLAYAGHTPLAIKVKNRAGRWVNLPKSQIEFALKGNFDRKSLEPSKGDQ